MTKQTREVVRLGIGYDVHRLELKRKLVLGGVRIPSDRGLSGHSDADVLIHAICDALLGAAALGDIGKHFPDTDKKYRNISSLKLLKHVGLLLRKKKFVINNIDSTLILEKPKIAPYVRLMQERIGKALDILPERISVKATTHEGLGSFGRGEGSAALAVASILETRLK
ncbi:MAG: 2-C-methyl-D-erythritol 2,4-cyclodiphosphate synthase [Ignavibacteriae bacterium]|nr:MAG: 2-C-methyl-D-erythritol 2,4-cyclodiphosphate synthase [Ignavibacteriota bacterium]